MTSRPTIDYEALAQDAMRGVVRAVLERAAKTGLPGDHHFYISFDTEAAGVLLSKRLKEKYPAEMTIVLQHRYWDLAVGEDRFEVKLTFDGIPERLVVPFAAIKVFFDPSVKYGLQFDDPDSNADESVGAARDGRAPRVPRKTSKPARKPRAVEGTAATTGALPNGAHGQNGANGAAPRPAPAPALTAVDGPAKGDAEASVTAIKSVDEKPANSGGAEIVSLDQFRKK